MLEDIISNIKLMPKRAKLKYFSMLLLALILALYFYFHNPPRKFPFNEVVTITTGESLQNITNNLTDLNVIKFPLIFRTTVILLGGERKVIAGDYLLDGKEGPIDLAYRLVRGDFHTESRRILIPEGWNIFDIGEYLEKNIKDFNKTEFLKLAKDKEGYLFPDTYFITNNTRPKTVINLMHDTFESKMKSVTGLATSTHSLKEIITMASILEREANTTESRRIVAGILWKRISLGMPLQVDATFSYINGKGTFELTQDDLKIDSPYNTYVYKGLPPTPICNPGLDAINSALNPTQTKYLYFLTSKSGKMYYATTFEQHKKNRELYLNK